MTFYVAERELLLMICVKNCNAASPVESVEYLYAGTSWPLSKGKISYSSDRRKVEGH